MKLTENNTTLLDLTITTSIEVGELMMLVQAATAPAVQAQSSNVRTQSIQGVGKTYYPLAAYLLQQDGDTLQMSFEEVEKVLGKDFSLPDTARGVHARSWWANTETHSQGKAWLAAGWRVVNLDVRKEEVEWRRQ